MKHTGKVTIMTAMAVAALLFSGCTQQEMALAQSMANSGAAVAASGKGTSVGNSLVANTLSSPAAMSGMVQSQVVGAQMLANPALLAVGGVGTALSEQQKAKNRKAFGKVTELYVNSDSVNHGMESMMLREYNRQHGTHYKSMRELQYAAKVQGYNKKYGTRFKTMEEVRVDYNRRYGTDYKSVEQLLAHR